MSQSKKHTFYETLLNTFSATLLNWALNDLLFILLGDVVASNPSIMAATFTLLYTIISLGRNYYARRAFNHYHAEKDPKGIKVFIGVCIGIAAVALTIGRIL